MTKKSILTSKEQLDQEKDQLDKEIELVNHVENFIFYRLRTSFSSPLRRIHPTLLFVQDQDLFKNVVYYLHSIDLFKESEIEKKVRLNPIKRHPEDNSIIEKNHDEMLSTHYDEILESIKKFHQTIKRKDPINKIKKDRKNIIKILSNHRDSFIIKNFLQVNQATYNILKLANIDNKRILYNKPDNQLPENFISSVYKEIENKIYHIQNSKKSHEIIKLKRETYISFLKDFYLRLEKYPEKELWSLLKFSPQQIRDMKNCHNLTQAIPITTISKHEMREYEKRHSARFDMLMGYINDEAIKCVKNTLIKHYEKTIEDLEKNNHTINKIQGIISWADDLNHDSDIGIDGPKKQVKIKRPKKKYEFYNAFGFDFWNKVKKDNNRLKSDHKEQVEDITEKKIENTLSSELELSKRFFLGDTNRILKSNPEILKNLERLLLKY